MNASESHTKKPQHTQGAAPADCHLRSATAADASAIREVVFPVLREHGIEPEPEITDADLFDLEEHYFKHGGRFFVLVENDNQKIVGTVGLHPESDGSVELCKMYLLPEHRGRGRGHFMLTKALEAARNLGFRRITLETSEKLPKAIGLYRRAGFTPCAPGHMAERCDQRMEFTLR